VDDEPRFRELYVETLDAAGLETVAAATGRDAARILSETEVAMVVSDVRMPGQSGLELLRQVRGCGNDVPFLLVTAHADIRDAVAALKLGAVDYLQKPVDLDELVAVVEDTLGMRHSTCCGSIPPDALRGIVAESETMRALLRDAHRVAASDATVLLHGESGTGKEVFAAFIHAASRRAGRPLVVVNAAAIPPTLLASELFGHEKGAFTGATNTRKGRFKEADGGTLFLDEIGDMPLDLQPALLRALEQGEILAVGSDRKELVDFRLIAATNRDLRQLVREKRFREDLYYRLNVIAFRIPSLRERPEDILPLARHFLAAEEHAQKHLSPAATRVLQKHDWPGNVRELSNAIERARILAPGEVILPEHLPPTVTHGPGNVTPPCPASAESIRTLEQAERAEVVKALEATEGNRTRAAELLGISRRALVYKIKKHGI